MEEITDSGLTSVEETNNGYVHISSVGMFSDLYVEIDDIDSLISILLKIKEEQC